VRSTRWAATCGCYGGREGVERYLEKRIQYRAFGTGLQKGECAGLGYRVFARPVSVLRCLMGSCYARSDEGSSPFPCQSPTSCGGSDFTYVSRGRAGCYVGLVFSVLAARSLGGASQTHEDWVSCWMPGEACHDGQPGEQYLTHSAVGSHTSLQPLPRAFSRRRSRASVR